MKRNANTKFLDLKFQHIYTHQSTEACSLPDPATRFGTAVSSLGVRVQFTFGIASAYCCYNTLVKNKVEIKIKSLLGINKIERCKIYVSLLATDTRILTYILQHAQPITVRPSLYRNAWWKKVINTVAYNDEKQ